MNSKSSASKRRTPSACSPASRQCGTRPTRCLPSARPALPANDPRMVKCADWILQKQVRNAGDWKIKNKQGQPGGWYFEFNNEFYPDVDDTAMVCLGLGQVEHPNGRYQRESVQRAIDWVLSMQCKNGGLASFDKDNDRWSSSTSPSPTTTPCSIRPRWTSPGASWKCSRPTATTRIIRR